MTTNRKTLRANLAALLTQEATSAQVVYGYGATRFDAQTPVIAITSAASERERLTMRGSRLTATFDVHVFVLHSDGGSWAEDDAEDAIDDIEQQIASACDKYPTWVGKWGLLRYDGPTDARDLVKIEGVDYLHETITIQMQEYT